MKDHTFSVPCMIITDFVMEARPFFESQIKIKDSSRYLLSKIPVLQQSAVGSSLVGEFSLCRRTPQPQLPGYEDRDVVAGAVRLEGERGDLDRLGRQDQCSVARVCF